MVSPSSDPNTFPTSPLQSPLSTKSTLSQASSSSQSGSTSRYTAPRHPNLPPPPPADRLPPPKGRSNHVPGHQKFRILRKGKDKDTSGDVEDEWTLEGAPANGHGPGQSRDSIEVLRGPESNPTPLSDSQLTEVPSNGSHEKRGKKSKGRSLVKKTSRLFSRDKSTEGENSGLVTPGSSSLTPAGSRQPSYSSVTSTNSQSTTSSSVHSHFAAPNRPPSNQSRSKLSRAGKSHTRQLSQDSQMSWHPPPRTVRSGSSSTYDSPTELGVPIPSRHGSQINASIPGLSRHALPQPNPNSATVRGPDSFPSRMSSWFSHLLPSNSTATIIEDTLTSASAESPAINPSSPLRKPPSAAASFLNAARQRAVDGVRHLLDTEAQPDRCPDTIWVLGVDHPGWRPSTPNQLIDSRPLPEMGNGGPEERRGSGSSGRPSPPTKNDSGALRPAAWPRRKEPSSSSTNSPASPPSKGFSNLFTTSTLSLASPSANNASPAKSGEAANAESPKKGRKDKQEKEVLKWPDEFYDDFRSRVWCTYRGQYAPIMSLPNSLLIPTPDAYFAAFGPPADATNTQPLPTRLAANALTTKPSTSSWSWSRTAEERGLTSDAGWGCMLRTGQSLLANSLIHLHLGRDWRLPAQKPPHQPRTPSQLKELEDYAEYVRLLTWFLDDPSPLCPFSVHRMALIGKELGKEVGEWFGPSTAAGALKTLANSFAPSKLSVATATDSVVYKSDVFAASHIPSEGWESDNNIPRPRRSSAIKYTTWGHKAVLILIGVRLGLDNVNSIYYESIKALFTFPQSVGIAGGRPSSSYYFVGSQAGSLFYLDPHLTRPAVPLEIPPAPGRTTDSDPKGSTEDEAVVIDTPQASGRSSPVNVAYTLDVVDVDAVPSDTDSSASSPSTNIRRAKRNSRAAKRLSAPQGVTPPRPAAPTSAEAGTPTTPQTRRADAFEIGETPTARRSSSISSAGPSEAEIIRVDPSTAWYVNAYSESQLRTFHCEKVKKMPFSSLDPSMLLGFMCKDETDFEDFINRAAKLPQKIFTVQDEPPSWDDDDDAGLESVSEPDLDMANDEEGSPVTSLRKHDILINDDVAVDEPAGESAISGNATVEPVDISASVTRRLGKMEVGVVDDDESWVGAPSTPASQQPVLIEKPAAQSPTPEAATTTTKTDRFEVGGDVVKRTVPPSSHQPIPTRTRTESWVVPAKDWHEAPNGDSML